MANTKRAVTDFLQLGAKYELILAGLYDDLVRLQGTVNDVERRNHDSSESVNRATSAVSEMQTVVMHVKEEVTKMSRKLEQQRTVIVLVGLVSIAAAILAVIA
jgi:hypothetical protein